MNTVAPKKRKKQWSTTKTMIVVVVCVILLIALIAGVKAMLVMRMMAGMKPPPPSVVTTAKAAYADWQPTLKAVGSLRAERGADLAFDVAGLVTRVNLKSGDEVKEGQVLVQLRDSEDAAQLQQLQASAALAEATFNRAKLQLDAKAISKADYDASAADLKAKQAAVVQQQVNVQKKQLRAPFSGRAGIIVINPGAYANSGTTIVTVQQLDRVFVDFHLPQKNIADLRVGQDVELTLDAFPGKRYEGKLTAINPKVDNDTRNVQVEASVPNPDHVLTPGMFGDISIEVGDKQRRLTLPQTAVVYNPYGETVYVVKHKSDLPPDPNAQAADANAAKAKSDEAKKAEKQKKVDEKAVAANDLVVQQVFVTTGGTRGDQVAIAKGLDEGAEVVTSGQIKLKNGAPITIDNKSGPANDPNPKPQEQ